MWTLIYIIFIFIFVVIATSHFICISAFNCIRMLHYLTWKELKCVEYSLIVILRLVNLNSFWYIVWKVSTCNVHVLLRGKYKRNGSSILHARLYIWHVQVIEPHNSVSPVLKWLINNKHLRKCFYGYHGKTVYNIVHHPLWIIVHHYK